MEKIFKLRKSNTQFYTVTVRTFVMPCYYGSGSSSAKAKKLRFLRFQFRLWSRNTAQNVKYLF